MANEYTPTLTGKDGLDIELTSTHGDSSYTTNTWSINEWQFFVDDRPILVDSISGTSENEVIDHSAWALNTSTINGGNIEANLTFGDSAYVSNTWKTNEWIFNISSHPTLVQSAIPTYTNSPIDYAVWSTNSLSRNGSFISRELALGSTHYTGNTWSANAWTFTDEEFPSSVIPAIATYVIEPVDYSTWLLTPNAFNGGNITSESAILSSTYNGNTWSLDVWEFINNQRPSLKTIPTALPLTDAIDFSAWLNIVTGMNGGNLTLEKAMQRKTYEYNVWPFYNVWGIREGSSFPRLLAKDGTIDAPPLTSQKLCLFVEESDDGSILYGETIWKPLERSIVFPATLGNTGQTVTHEYVGDEVNYPTSTETFVFMASGVQDPTYPSGYGDVQPLTERTVTYQATRSSNVAFYYVAAPEPVYDYLMQIAASSLTFHIALFANDVSSVKVKMSDGIIASVGLVAVGSADASPIRIMTKDGIFALQHVESLSGGTTPVEEPTHVDSEFLAVYDGSGTFGNIAKNDITISGTPYTNTDPVSPLISSISVWMRNEVAGIADFKIRIVKGISGLPELTETLYVSENIIVNDTVMREYSVDVPSIPIIQNQQYWIVVDVSESSITANMLQGTTDASIGNLKYVYQGWKSYSEKLAYRIGLKTPL